jgi:hypothetical protein
MRGRAMNMHLFSRGIPRLMSSVGDKGPQKVWKSNDHKKEHTEGNASPQGAGKILIALHKSTTRGK